MMWQIVCIVVIASCLVGLSYSTSKLERQLRQALFRENAILDQITQIRADARFMGRNPNPAYSDETRKEVQSSFEWTEKSCELMLNCNADQELVHRG